MKILYSSTYTSLSGANRSLLALLGQEKAIGNEVAVISPKEKNKSEIAEALISNGIENHEIYATSSIIRQDQKLSIKTRLIILIKNIISEFQVIRIIKKFKPDILHINTVSGFNGYYAAKICNVPIVWHIREFVHEDYNFKFINEKAMYRKLGKANAVIAISQSIYNKFEPLINNQNMVTIYNGIDLNKYVMKKFDVFENQKVVMAVIGRLIPGKGQLDAIKATIKLFNEGINDIELDLYGGEADDDYLRKIKKCIAGTSAKIYLRGITNDICEVYDNTDIVIVSSRYEPFGRVTVEAMCCGCLVIGANTGGTKELIKDKENGFLYEEGSYESLAKTIEYAISHRKEAKKIVKNANILARNAYSVEMNTIKINKIYNSVIHHEK